MEDRKPRISLPENLRKSVPKIVMKKAHENQILNKLFQKISKKKAQPRLTCFSSFSKDGSPDTSSTEIVCEYLILRTFRALKEVKGKAAEKTEGSSGVEQKEEEKIDDEKITIISPLNTEESQEKDSYIEEEGKPFLDCNALISPKERHSFTFVQSETNLTRTPFRSSYCEGKAKTKLKLFPSTLLRIFNMDLQRFKVIEDSIPESNFPRYWTEKRSMTNRDLILHFHSPKEALEAFNLLHEYHDQGRKVFCQFVSQDSQGHTLSSGLVTIQESGIDSHGEESSSGNNSRSDTPSIHQTEKEKSAREHLESTMSKLKKSLVQTISEEEEITRNLELSKTTLDPNLPIKENEEGFNQTFPLNSILHKIRTSQIQPPSPYQRNPSQKYTYSQHVRNHSNQTSTYDSVHSCSGDIAEENKPSFPLHMKPKGMHRMQNSFGHYASALSTQVGTEPDESSFEIPHGGSAYNSNNSQLDHSQDFYLNRTQKINFGGLFGRQPLSPSQQRLLSTVPNLQMGNYVESQAAHSRVRSMEWNGSNTFQHFQFPANSHHNQFQATYFGQNQMTNQSSLPVIQGASPSPAYFSYGGQRTHKLSNDFLSPRQSMNLEMTGSDLVQRSYYNEKGQLPTPKQLNYDSLGNTRKSKRKKCVENEEEQAKYIIQLRQVITFNDPRTSLMIKNIPNKYSQKMLLGEINENFRGKYDFFYLPNDFKNKCNLGYAFINFTYPLCILEFFAEFNGKRWTKFNSDKVCLLKYGRIQGKKSLYEHFETSTVMTHVKVKPLIIDVPPPLIAEQKAHAERLWKKLGGTIQRMQEEYNRQLQSEFKREPKDY